MSVPDAAIVSIQPDPYSPTIMTFAENRKNIYNDRIGTKSGGRRVTRRMRRMRRRTYRRNRRSISQKR